MLVKMYGMLLMSRYGAFALPSLDLVKKIVYATLTSCESSFAGERLQVPLLALRVQASGQRQWLHFVKLPDSSRPQDYDAHVNSGGSTGYCAGG
jgi:hypothetical protein